MTKSVVAANKNFFNNTVKALKTVNSSNVKSLESLFSSGDKVKTVSIGDSNVNKQVIENIESNVKNAKENGAVNNKAKNKSQKLKTGKFCGYKVKSTKVKGNTINIVAKTKKGKTVKGTISYAQDGSRISTLTVGKIKTTKVIDKKGNLREKTTANKKTKSKNVKEYDKSGILNKSTTTKEENPVYKDTTFYDDNGKAGYRVIKDVDQTQKMRYEYSEKGNKVGIYTTTINYDDDDVNETHHFRAISNKKDAVIATNKNANNVVTTNVRFNDLIKDGTDFGLAKPANGELDEVFCQQSEGDCWFLAGIKALSSTEAGSKAIKDSIKKHINGDITVNFQGVNPPCGQSYRITLEEIVKNHLKSEFSNGDDDAYVLEMAAKRLRNDLYQKQVQSGPGAPKNLAPRASMTGGWSNEAIYYFTGVSGEVFYNENLNESKINELLDDCVKNKNTILTFALDKGKYKADVVDDTQHNFKLNLDGSHAFSISNVADDTITFENPWDSGEEFTISRESFLKMKPFGMTRSVLNS